VEQRVYRRTATELLTTNDHEKDQRLPVLMHAAPVITLVSHAPPLVCSIPTPESELIPTLFFQYFAVEDTTSGYSLSSCLPRAIPKTDNDPLSVAVSSLGYVLLSAMTKSPDKLILARQKYAVAVRLTCNILENSVASETCSVIRIILILALFEVSKRDLLFLMRNLDSNS
jgi:hypothetical protein